MKHIANLSIQIFLSISPCSHLSFASAYSNVTGSTNLDNGFVAGKIGARIKGRIEKRIE